MPEKTPAAKKNVLLWKFGSPCTRGLKDYLADDLDVKVWIDKGKYPTSTIDMDDLYKQLRLRKKTGRLGINYRHRKEFVTVYPDVMKHANTFLYMYSRYPSFNGENNFLDMMDAMLIYTHFFIDILKTNGIDYVFASRIPHRGHDFVLYLVAKALGIKTFMFMQAAANQVFVTTDMNEVGSLEVEGETAEPVPIERNRRRSYYYMKKQYKTNPVVKAALTLLFRKDPDLATHHFLNARKAGQFKKCYRRTAATELPQGKFVYFALHYQPELTTASWGGKFVDQVLALEHLRAMLPDDWSIVAKEHPQQRFNWRSPFFFERLTMIPNLSYLEKNVDTFDLIDKAEFVATITGTVGIEALSYGKPVLIFGDAVYKNFPGVVRYREGLSSDDVLNASFSHTDLESAHARLQKNLIEAVVHEDTTHHVKNFSPDKNARTLAKVINQLTRGDQSRTRLD